MERDDLFEDLSRKTSLHILPKVRTRVSTMIYDAAKVKVVFVKISALPKPKGEEGDLDPDKAKGNLYNALNTRNKSDKNPDKGKYIVSVPRLSDDKKLLRVELKLKATKGE